MPTTFDVNEHSLDGSGITWQNDESLSGIGNTGYDDFGSYGDDSISDTSNLFGPNSPLRNTRTTSGSSNTPRSGMNNTNNMNNKHEQQHQNEQGKAVCSRLPPRLQGNRPRVALQRRQPEGELPQLFRAGWISMLLLECLWKQCNHPAQGLACFSASSMCRIPAAENKCRVRTVSGALRRRLGKTRAGSVRTDDEFSDRQAARRP